MIEKHYLIDEFVTNVNNALAVHDPIVLYVAYSGGHDSATVLHIISQVLDEIQHDDIRCMTIDTGLSSYKHIDRLRKEVDQLGIPFEVYTGSGLNWYVNNVRSYGYGYSYPHHTIYYRMLKERAIAECIRSQKKKRSDRVAFITGVRRVESARRANRDLVYRKGSRVTINAIAMYTDSDKRKIMTDCNWWTGRTTEDCMCNWSCRYTLDDLKGTEAYDYIAELNQEMKEIGLWGYGEKPSGEQIQMLATDDDDMPEDSLCISCYRQLELPF